MTDEVDGRARWARRLGENVHAQAAAVCCVVAAAAGAAVDVGVTGRKLAIVDGGPTDRSKVVFVANGDEIGKGGGTDASGIAASIQIVRGDASGRFAVPAGALAVIKPAP